MKKRVFLVVAALLVLGLGVATFAYKQSSNASTLAISCCKGDSCPMKKDASGKETASCCDDCDCCKGASCPMKNKGAQTAVVDANMQMAAVATSVADCPCSCCNHTKAN